ncbi:MAG: hypothetical protein ABEH77_02445 [Halobacteriaceae archaeon]
MVREELQAASDALRRAAEAAAEDAEERIYEQSNQLATLAAREADPDHGRLARHMNALDEILDDVEGEVREHVEHALERVREYREGVEGV